MAGEICDALWKPGPKPQDARVYTCCALPLQDYLIEHCFCFNNTVGDQSRTCILFSIIWLKTFSLGKLFKLLISSLHHSFLMFFLLPTLNYRLLSSESQSLVWMERHNSEALAGEIWRGERIFKWETEKKCKRVKGSIMYLAISAYGNYWDVPLKLNGSSYV